MAEDRMSQLPDDILHLILDKIGIFQAVETAILSKRWKKLWCSLPALRFHFSLPVDWHLPPYEHNRSQLLSHCQRVSQFLSHRDASAAVHAFHLSFASNDALDFVHAFHLSFGSQTLLGGGVDRSFVEDCALYAINHGVQSLHLHSHDLRHTWLPAAIFACKTLKELDLRDLFVNSKDPFSGLPELEKLTLLKYLVRAPIVINAPKLRLLKLYGCFVVKRIYAPLLTSLTYKASDVWECADADLPMLEHVYLDIHKSKYCHDQNHTNFLAMLHQLRNATTVSLTLDTIKILRSKVGFSKQIPPIFPNMKCLKVMEGRHGNYTVLQSVMEYLSWTFNCKVEHSPNLLVIADEDDMTEEDEDDEDYHYVVDEDGYEYGNA